MSADTDELIHALLVVGIIVYYAAVVVWVLSD